MLLAETMNRRLPSHALLIAVVLATLILVHADPARACDHGSQLVGGWCTPNGSEASAAPQAWGASSPDDVDADEADSIRKPTYAGLVLGVLAIPAYFANMLAYGSVLVTLFYNDRSVYRESAYGTIPFAATYLPAVPLLLVGHHRARRGRGLEPMDWIQRLGWSLYAIEAAASCVHAVGLATGSYWLWALPVVVMQTMMIPSLVIAFIAGGVARNVVKQREYAGGGLAPLVTPVPGGAVLGLGGIF